MKPKLLTMNIERCRPIGGFGEEQFAGGPVRRMTVNSPAAHDSMPVAVRIEIGRQKKLLLVSDDADLAGRLTNATGIGRLEFKQIPTPSSALSWIRRHHPAIVCLDLDLPVLAGWRLAEDLLEEEACPSLMLVCGRSNQFDLDAAVESGALVSRSASPAQLLEKTDRILEEAVADRVDQKLRQRVLLRWLKPYDWAMPEVHPYRFWGINE